MMVGNPVAVGLTRSTIITFVPFFIRRHGNGLHVARTEQSYLARMGHCSFTLRYQFEGNARATSLLSGREGRCSVPAWVLSIVHCTRASLHARWPIRTPRPICTNQDAWLVITPKRPMGNSTGTTPRPEHRLEICIFRDTFSRLIYPAWPSCHFDLERSSHGWRLLVN